MTQAIAAAQLLERRGYEIVAVTVGTNQSNCARVLRFGRFIARATGANLVPSCSGLAACIHEQFGSSQRAP